MNLTRAKAGVVTVGRVYCDLIFTDVPRLPTMGTEIYSGGFGIHAGGGACITAAHLVSLGRRAALAATLPRGPLGAAVKSELESALIDLSLCRMAEPGTEPQVTAVLAGGGDRAFVTHRAGPAAPLPGETALRALGIGHMHIGELATLVEMPGLLQLARSAGISVSLDCSWDESVEAADAAPLIAAVDVFLPNAAEAARLIAMGLAQPFAPLTVIKRGADGAAAFWDGEQVSAAAVRTTPVDTTGAGDAFNAGFLNAWLDGKAVSDCLQAGNRAGARAITVRGGFAPAVQAPAAGEMVR